MCVTRLDAGREAETHTGHASLTGRKLKMWKSQNVVLNLVVASGIPLMKISLILINYKRLVTTQKLSKVEAGTK